MLRVIYFGEHSGNHLPIFEAEVRDGAVTASRVVTEAERRPVTAASERLIRARSVIAGRSQQRCTNGSMNMVLLPAETGNNTLVYVLSSQVEAGVYPAGGHHRFTVSGDGRVRSERAFAKSCIALSDWGPNGEPTVESVLSHLLDPQPTEIHVWLSRWMGKPLKVITIDRRVWRIADGRIGRPQSLPSLGANR